MFHRGVGEMISIQYLEYWFHEALRDMQTRELGLIPQGVYVGRVRGYYFDDIVEERVQH